MNKMRELTLRLWLFLYEPIYKYNPNNDKNLIRCESKILIV